MTKIKILFVLPSLRGGGAERVVLALLKNIAKGKFQLELVLLEETGDYLEKIPQDIKIHNLNKKRARWALFSLAKLIRQEKPDILFTTLPQIVAITYLSLKFVKVKPIWLIRRANYEPPGVVPLITRLFLKKAYQKADKVICVSQGLAGDLKKNWHISERKIKVIYNPIDIENIQNLAKELLNHSWFTSQTPVIIAVGRLTKQKGFSLLIKAFALVISKLKPKLIILGQGPEKKRLREISKQLGIERQVEFLGFQKNPYRFIARAKVFVLSSLWEGFPNVLVEAMTCGTPVVATDCPFGPREILGNGKYGLLVPKADEKALAAAVLKIFENSQLAQNFSEKAKERIKDFAKDKIIKEYENLFLELCQRK